MICPNTNSPEWKELVSKIGTYRAFEEFIRIGEIPNPNNYTDEYTGVNTTLKVFNALTSPKIEQFFTSQYLKGNKEKFYNEVKAIAGSQQTEMLKNLGDFSTLNDMISSLLANTSYTIEVNTAKEGGNTGKNQGVAIAEARRSGLTYGTVEFNNFIKDYLEKNDEEYIEKSTSYYSNLTVSGGTNYTENEIATPAIIPSIKGHAQFATDKGIGWFRSDDKVNNPNLARATKIWQEYVDRNASEEEMTKVNEMYNEEKAKGIPTKTRRILEVQSDLFQKGRDKDLLVNTDNKILDGKDQKNENDYYVEDEYDDGQFRIKTPEGIYFRSNNNYLFRPNNGTVKDNSQVSKNVYFSKIKETQGIGIKENQFLQLLNKDNAWVTFFVKSIIQDSIKKEYEKVLFPVGDTAAKIEGHSTVTEYVEVKEKRKQEIIEESKIPQKSESWSISWKGEWGGIGGIYDTKKEAEDYARSAGYSDFSKLAFKRSQIKPRDFKIELDQLEKEIEDAKAGKLKISSIANFYEKHIFNILNKLGTVKKVQDEYGNSWNEIDLSEQKIRESSTNILFSQGNTLSKASAATVEKVKEWLTRLGIDIQTLDTERYNGVNGVAQLLSNTIQIAEGKENVALPEEGFHFIVEILKSTNPILYKAMLNKIGNYALYKNVLDSYGQNKAYQNVDGSLNIIKLKEEAIGKVLSEYYIQSEDGIQSKYLEQTNSWWEQIKEWFMALINHAEFNPFQETIKQLPNIEGSPLKALADRIDLSAIKSGVYRQVIQDEIERGNYLEPLNMLRDQLSDPNSYAPTLRDFLNGDRQLAQEIMNSDLFQIATTKVDEVYNKFIEEDKKLALVGQGTSDRHYTYNGEGHIKSVTQKIDDSKRWGEPTPEQILRTSQTGEWGTEGHNFIANYITENLIDENGFKRAQPLNTTVPTPINPAIQNKLRDFASELINSYPDGTKFLIEKKVINQKEKGGLAGTVDFVAVFPVGEDVKVDILDWKFVNIAEGSEDIPFYKIEKWKKQIGEYITIVKQYGLTSKQLGKARMVPFATKYIYNKKGDDKSGIKLSSIEIGDRETKKLYLLPVPSNEESTGNSQIDKLLISLRGQYKKIYDKPVSEQERATKNEQLNQLARSIRTLHIQMNFDPLAIEGIRFELNADRIINKLTKVDFSKLPLSEINNNLKELLELEKTAETYSDLDQVFISAYPKDELNDEQKKTLTKFEKVAKSTDRLILAIRDLQSSASAAIAIKEGILKTSLEEATENILSPELELQGLGKTFLEGTQLSNRVINLASNLLLNSKSKQYQEERKLAKQFEDLFTPFLEATKSLKDPIDAIRDMSSSTLKLIRKIDKQVYKDAQEAREGKNKKFFLENMDMSIYNKLVEDKMASSTKNIMETLYSNDSTENLDIQEGNIEKLRNSIDINSKEFNGWNDYNFKYFFNQSIDEAKHTSNEYKEMARNPAILAVWNFYTNLNKRARDSGFIDKQGLGFIALIQGNIIERLSKADNIYKETQKLIKDGYIVNVNERLSHAQIDPETGKIVKRVPRLFTTTDKEISQLSKDLSKITGPWIHALLSYETQSELENILLTLHEVEQSKGHLQLDPATKKVIFENSEPKMFEGNEKNAALLEKMIDDYIYGITEDNNTLLDAAISKGKGTEEEKEKKKLQGKKILRAGNAWTQMLATGGKLMVALPNFVGGKLQAAINAGTFYKGREFEKNTNLLMIGQSLSNVDKALIHMIHPLNEDVSLENTRNIAKKQSTLKWLSTWSIQDAMQSMNRFGDRMLEMTNAKTFNDNSMIMDGKIINIRQYVGRQDARKYGLSESERREIEGTFEQRVKDLKESSSLSKTLQFNEHGELDIPVSPEELAKYRTLVVEYGRKISGQMSRDNKADYTRSAIFRSFMMFKNWIPKQVSLRTLDIKKNNELDTWEYGRTRLFVKVWSHLGWRNILSMRNIISGNEKGLATMKEILDEKKEAYYQATGQELEITEEEFYDLVRKELYSQSKELTMLLGVLSLFLSAKLAAPDDDDDEITKNRYKWWRKLTNKISDEVAFYYNPASADSITRGSIIPSLGLLNKVQKFIKSLEEETRGHVIDDEDLIDKNHPLKYFFNIVPGASQLQNEILPYVAPDMAKDMGIRVTEEARQGQ